MQGWGATPHQVPVSDWGDPPKVSCLGGKLRKRFVLLSGERNSFFCLKAQKLVTHNWGVKRALPALVARRAPNPGPVVPARRGYQPPCRTRHQVPLIFLLCACFPRSTAAVPQNAAQALHTFQPLRPTSNCRRGSPNHRGDVRVAWGCKFLSRNRSKTRFFHCKMALATSSILLDDPVAFWKFPAYHDPTGLRQCMIHQPSVVSAFSQGGD